MLGLRGLGSYATHNGGSVLAVFGLLEAEFMLIFFRLTKCGF
jgi:hypothetical protein